METDTVLERPAQPRAPQVATDETIEVRFRPFRVFTWRMVPTILGLFLGMFIGAAQSKHGDRIGDPRFILFMFGIAALAVLILLVPRCIVKLRGGLPPLRFGRDTIEVPVNDRSRRTRTFGYEDILSAAVYGRKRRAVLILDTKKRAFVYPLRNFADPDVAAIINDILSRRIPMRPGGAEQWPLVLRRQQLAALFASFRPRATQAITALIVGAFLLQMTHGGDDIYGLLDLGANAPFLVRQGEWFRLVTANLLHGGLLHIYCNAVFGYIIGALVERQLGARRFLLLVMVTGILSQGVSALWALHTGMNHLMSVGISGALFGMLGAQAVLNRRFRAQLPGGYRFSSRTWWSMLIVNFLVIPGMVPQVDVACHVGGFLSGIVAGWLLCRNQTDIGERPPFGPLQNLAFSIGVALWLAAVAQAASNYFAPEKLEADHRALILAELQAAHPLAQVDNALAWKVATSPKPSPDDLNNALALATRALAAVQGRADADPKYEDATMDTLATVYYRQGNFDLALTMESALAAQGGDAFGSQLARFVDASYRARGVKLAGELPGGLPVLKDLGNRSFDISLPHHSDGSMEVYALLMQDGKVLGLAAISLEAFVDRGTFTLPESAYEAATPGGSPPQLVIAYINALRCDCEEGKPVSLRFTLMLKSVAELP